MTRRGEHEQRLLDEPAPPTGRSSEDTVPLACHVAEPPALVPSELPPSVQAQFAIYAEIVGIAREAAAISAYLLAAGGDDEPAEPRDRSDRPAS